MKGADRLSSYCLFTAQYLPTVGGVENYNHNLAKQLIKEGHEVLIVTSALDNLPTYERSEFGFSILRVPSFQLMGGRLPVTKPFAGISHLLKKHLPDDCRVVINTRFYPLSLFAARYAKKRRLFAIVIEHGSAHLSFGRTLPDMILKWYEHIVCALVRRYCNRFYAVSGLSADWLRHFGIAARGVIPNAVDPLEISDIDENLFSLQKYGLEDHRILCYVGRMIPEKGVLQLTEAFDELKEEYPNARLVMAGDGSLFPRIKECRYKNVVLTGRLSHDECISLMKRAEIFCLPTVSEGFSTTLLEAVLCRCFVITTKGCGGVQEIFGEKISEHDGIIMQKGDKDSIKNALRRALEKDQDPNPDTVQNLRDNNGWRQSAERLRDCFR